METDKQTPLELAHTKNTSKTSVTASAVSCTSLLSRVPIRQTASADMRARRRASSPAPAAPALRAPADTNASNSTMSLDKPTLLVGPPTEGFGRTKIPISRSMSPVNRKSSPAKGWSIKKYSVTNSMWESTTSAAAAARRRRSPVPVSADFADALLLQSVPSKSVTTGDEDMEYPPYAASLASAASASGPVSVAKCGDVSAARKLTHLLSSRKREFVKTKRNLEGQQKGVLAEFASLKELERKLRECGGAAVAVGGGGAEDGALSDMSIVDVGRWGGFDLRLLTRDRLAPDMLDVGSDLGGSVLQDLRLRLRSIPQDVLTLCNLFIDQQLTLVEWFRARVKSDKFQPASVTNIAAAAKKKLRELEEDMGRMQEQADGAIAGLRVKIDHVFEIVKIAWVDRDQLMKRLEKAQRELRVTQRRLEEAGDNRADNRHTEQRQELDNAALEEARTQVVRERAARESLKEVVTSAEGTLRVTRARIADLERQLKDSQAETELARRKCKELDVQSRHRESSFDARNRKLKEVSKCGEVTIDTLTKQRDALELRVRELSEQVAAATEAGERRLAEEARRAATLEARAAERQSGAAEAEARARMAERRAADLERAGDQMRERCRQLLQLHEERQAELLPLTTAQGGGGSTSDREVELWKELQTARLATARAKEELRRARRDKDAFLSQLSRIAQKEDNKTVQDKMAQELIEKEKRNSKLQDVIAGLEKNEKLNEERVREYEQQISELRLQVTTLRNYDCITKLSPPPLDQLHIEMTELHVTVATLSAERAELRSAVAARSLELERHERAAELHRRALRLRDQLRTLLQSRAPLPDDCDEPRLDWHLLSRCASEVRAGGGAETWSALRHERARVQRLESVVRAQHDQLQREQGERARLEQARAHLDRTIQQHAKADKSLKYAMS